MWDIIALFFLTRRIGLIAEKKGLKPVRWKLYVVLAWFIAESVGARIGMKIYNVDFQDITDNIGSFISSKSFMMINLIGWGFAVASYFTIKDFLQRKADIKPKHYDSNHHVED